jgi:hypothetical protein
MKKIILISVFGTFLLSCQETCPTTDVNELSECLCETSREYGNAIVAKDEDKIADLDSQMEIIDEEVAAELDKGTYTSEELAEAMVTTDCE